MEYNIHYDFAAIALSLVTLLHYYGKKNIKTRQTKVFKWLLFMNLASAVLDIITAKFNVIDPPIWVGYLVNIAYLMVFNLMPYIYYKYLTYSINSGIREKKYVRPLTVLPLSIIYGLLISTPWTGLMFIYDGDGYRHGPLFVMLYAVSILYMLMSLGAAIINRNRYTGRQRASIYFYTVVCVAAALLQMYFVGTQLVHYAAALAVLLCYLAIENPEDDEDKEFDIYNRNAFVKKINLSVRLGRKFRILGLNIVGHAATVDTIGVAESQVIMKGIVSRIKDIVYPMEMFNMSQGQFAMYTEDMKIDINTLVDKIQQEFKKTFNYNGIGVALGSNMYQLEFPKDVSRLEDILDIMAYSADKKRNTTGEAVMHASSEILLDRRRENQVKQAIRQAVLDTKFQVFYQPIFSVQDGCYNSAEALVRLYDDELGFISPEEFIPMAEKNGLILEIGEFVFREVCKMFCQNRLTELGIKYVEVNLSVVQCMQERLHEILVSIMDEYNVPYECINLEITETATTANVEVLENNMEQLMARGITFSLDDYGTGYSNTSNVIKYPFYIIKLDKSMVWTAMENERAKSALKHTVAMIKDLGMHIVAEGVENEEHIRILTDMGCDYLQGFYFSKPIPAQEFIACVRHGNKIA
ncbi:MAG: EAL domain-containing protein [Wujia sp.]